jgi:hypothetical protein
MEPIKLTPSSGGYLFADWRAGKAWVRLGHDRQQRLNRIVELHVLNPTIEQLRRLPLRRIHAAATMRGAGALQLALAMRINEPPPDLSKPPKEEGWPLVHRYRLKRPTGRKLDEDFFKNVAHAYESAIAFGLNPRQAIVADTGASDATVARWIMEARKPERKYLPSTQPGKATA